MEQSLFPKAIVSGGCVEAGTLIKTVNGLTAIEEIRVGDYVDTLLGPKKVTYTWTPETLDDGEPECYDITFDDGHKVRCSSAHKFLIDGKWVEAKDIAVGDDVDVA
jgi:intein/homing endonuclease